MLIFFCASMFTSCTLPRMALHGDMVWFVVMSDDTSKVCPAADGALAAAPTKPIKRKSVQSPSTKKKKAKQTEPDGKLFVTCIIHTSNQTIKQSNNQTIKQSNKQIHTNKSTQTIKQSNTQQIHTHNKRGDCG